MSVCHVWDCGCQVQWAGLVTSENRDGGLVSGRRREQLVKYKVGAEFPISQCVVSCLRDIPGPKMSGYKTRSDSLMLMRQIKNLKDLGSNLGGDLETSSRTFLSGVQIVRTGNKPEVVLWAFAGEVMLLNTYLCPGHVWQWQWGGQWAAAVRGVHPGRGEYSSRTLEEK